LANPVVEEVAKPESNLVQRAVVQSRTAVAKETSTSTMAGDRPNDWDEERPKEWRRDHPSQEGEIETYVEVVEKCGTVGTEVEIRTGVSALPA